MIKKMRITTCKMIVKFYLLTGIILFLSSCARGGLVGSTVLLMQGHGFSLDLTDDEIKEIIDTIDDNMILVEGGEFKMGNDKGGMGFVTNTSNEKPLHSVTLDDFYISKFEVTQELWKSIMEDDPSMVRGKGRPVEQVTWYDIVKFCNKLSEKKGLQKCYNIGKETGFIVKDREVSCDFKANGYRLPTEAEWEYAAKGGNKTNGYEYSGSNDIAEVAWYTSFAIGKPEIVGAKLGNELGIYDMTGNVWEYCWDSYDSYKSEALINPTGPEKEKYGNYRVRRGGCRNLRKNFCGVTFRQSLMASMKDDMTGFRIAITSNKVQKNGN